MRSGGSSSDGTAVRRIVDLTLSTETVRTDLITPSAYEILARMLDEGRLSRGRPNAFGEPTFVIDGDSAEELFARLGDLWG